MNAILRLALALALSLAAGAYAGVDITLLGGYTTVGMGDFNDSNSKAADALKAMGASDASATKVSDGYYAGLDAAFEVSEGYTLGPRAEYVSVGRSTLTSSFAGAQYKATNDISFFPFLLGFGAAVALPPNGLSLRGGLYAGWGLAKARVQADNAGTLNTSNASGSCFMGELDGSLRYKIIPLLSLNLDLGYRLATVGAMVDEATNATWTKTGGTDALKLDFSGLNAGASLGFSF